MQKNDIHDELVNAYLEYFSLNEEWNRRPSVRRYYSIRRQVKKIIDLGKERNKEIRQEYLDSKEKYANPNNSRPKKKK